MAPFVIVLSPSQEDQGHAVRARGLGVVALDGVTTLGWFDASAVAIDPGCHVVLVGNTDEQLSKFIQLAGGARQVCVDSTFRGMGR